VRLSTAAMRRRCFMRLVEKLSPGVYNNTRKIAVDISGHSDKGGWTGQDARPFRASRQPGRTLP
jgi:hypothetical protein